MMQKDEFTWIRQLLSELCETSIENIHQFAIDFSEEKAEIKYMSPLQDEKDPAQYSVGRLYFQWSKHKKKID